MAKDQLNLITVTTVNTLGPQPMDTEFPQPAMAAEARGQLTPSPITDTDMVLDTMDTDTWASLDTPDLLHLLLPGSISNYQNQNSSL